MMESIKGGRIEKLMDVLKKDPKGMSAIMGLRSEKDVPGFLKESIEGDTPSQLVFQPQTNDAEVDDRKSVLAGKIFEGVTSFIESNSWHVSVSDRDRRLLALGFSMRNTSLKVLIRIDADAESLSINTTLPITCLEEYRILMGSKLSKINETLRFGAFRLDEDDGEITYRFSYLFTEQGFLPAVFEKYLNCCLITSDMNYKEIAKTATGAIPNQEKINIINSIRKLTAAITD